MSTDALSGTDRSQERSWPARLPPTRFLRTVRYVISANFVGKKSHRLYLDDLHFGRRFTSRTHVVDEEQIKAFARQFDPRRSILITRLCFRDWRQAVGTRLRSPCAFWSRAACHSPVVSSGLAVNLIGQIRPGLVILYSLRVKCWTLDPRDPGKVEGLPLCKAGRAIRGTRWRSA
jgi:hypothetical protein